MHKSLGQFIGGKWITSPGAETIISVSPVNGKEYFSAELATIDQIDMCSEIARAACGGWATFPINERSDYVRSFISEVEKSAAELAEAISWEVGKPLWEAKTEVSALAGKLKPSLEALTVRGSKIGFDQPGNAVVETNFVPLGVCAVIAPFNFPLHMPNGHIIPALLAGNTIVFKPSPQAPRSSELYAQCWERSGLPKGVFNMIHAVDIGSGHLVAQKEVDGVFFTGSSKVGMTIFEAAGPEKMVALEMGGDSATIVADTSETEGAVVSLLQSAFITSGQRCSSTRRLIVLDTDKNRQLIDVLVAATKKVSVGLPFDDDQPFMGPLKSVESADAALKMQDSLLALGANPLVKSEKLERCDALLTPGILEMPSNHTETEPECLSPIVRLYWVNDLDEAISLANATDYGLAAGVFTENDEVFSNLAARLNVGNVNRNQATTGNSAWGSFGGTKMSGNFRPSGFLAVDYCVKAKAVFDRNEIVRPKSLPEGLSNIFN